MVNTRRMESNSSTQGPRHRTRGSVRLLKAEVPEDSGSSSVNESDCEDSADKETSSNTPGKTNAGIKRRLPSRQLRSFPLTGRKYKPEAVRSGHKRLPLEQRALVYSHKMHEDSDAYGHQNESDEEIYTVRSRRRRHLIRMNRIQRRTALSLRPISQKSYADSHSPLHFNSDSEAGVRRSKRKRQVNISWLADSQMHKVGYPNLNAGYFEEDSRDAVEVDAHNDIEISRRVTRNRNELGLRQDSKPSNYLYEYENDISTRRRTAGRSNLDNKKELRSERIESNDKENKKENGISFETNGRLRSKKIESYAEKDSEENQNVESSEGKNKIKEEPKINGDIEESTKPQKESKAVPEQSSDSEDQDHMPLTRLRPNRNTFRSNRTDFSTRSASNFASRTTNKFQSRNNRNFPARPARNGKDMDSSSSEEEERRQYSLRDRRPKPAPTAMQTSVLKSREIRTRRHFKRRRRQSSSSSDDSSSSSNVCRSKPPKSPHSKNEKVKMGGGGSMKFAPIKPEMLDTSVRFNSIGGLHGHVQCLKEMIVLPMLYPEVFRQFQIKLPRGVLFHGPPGTGKTLMARALANECSIGRKKVAFFMRKGADLLSKWMGESERQLRLLFQQAAEMKPSIIFFDELDGIAPIRSAKQDQHLASIVSTLLALMDGIDDRGDIIVIGATNRIDAIDPALRRPGRFDRELYFPLPSRNEREEILKVCVANWFKPPSENLINYLAENTIGYCGADLRALCTEAVIQSFRRTYPQVYNSEFRLLLNPENVRVEKVDFMRAKSLLIPASLRVTQCLAKKLCPVLEPILQEPLTKALGILQETFPHGLNSSLAKVKLSSNMRPAQLLITGDGPEHGQTVHLAPAILYKMEHIHSYLLDLSILYQETATSIEEVCLRVFKEAKRDVPSVIYIPSIDKLWNLVNETVRGILEAQLAQLDLNVPILFLATSDLLYDELPERIQIIFSKYRKEVMHLNCPSAEVRRKFYRPLIIDGSMKEPRIPRGTSKTPPPLPRAATPPPTPMTETEKKKIYELEEHTLRELRIFLRDMCKKLASNKLFFMFTKPVDTEEVPDYTQIIKQPMDLETMMTKVDFHRYECAKDFLNDIELICRNALEYNPAKTSADKQIRHRACSLRDYAYTLIKTEMDTDFEDKCQEISLKRKERKHCPTNYLPPYIYTPDGVIDMPQEENRDNTTVNGGTTVDGDTTVNGDSPSNTPVEQAECKTPSKKRKRFGWQKGILKKRRRILSTSVPQAEEKVSSGDDSKENDIEVQTDKPARAAKFSDNKKVTPEVATKSEISLLTINCDIQSTSKEIASPLHSPKRTLNDLRSPSELLDNPLDFDEVEEALNETTGSDQLQERLTIECSKQELDRVLDQAVKLTEGYSLNYLLDLYNHLNKVIKKYSRTHIRTSLPKELSKELLRFKKGSPEFSKPTSLT